jgi:hypothetical protein
MNRTSDVCRDFRAQGFGANFLLDKGLDED